MKVLISGAQGLIGTELFWTLHKKGHDIVRLVRSVSDVSGADICWDPHTGAVDPARFEGFDAVIHLAGDNIAGRWSEKKKQRIRDSRVIGTKNLSEILARLQKPPRVFVVASAIGYYGNRGDAALDETSQPGTGFLPEVCQEWEAATKPASDKGIRTVSLRFGVVLSPKGGALKMMLPPFKLGVAGIIGDGKQYMSWVALEDVVGAIEKAAADTTLSGPVNVVAPEPVTNAVFTEILGNVLSRPTYLPMPAFVARLAFGEMADALLLASARVAPKKLQAAGYVFAQPKLEPALRKLLSR